MSELKVRRIPFEFEGVNFIWNPANPKFSINMNVLTFFAIGLEKYFCQAIRDAEPLIKDPAILEEARQFRGQEGIHSNAHRRHAKALIEKYPGLQSALDKIIAHFDKLYAEKDLNYHLAYAGGLESIFTPTFRMQLDNLEPLYGKGDSRVASLLIWHFCEEIEHRSAALTVYNEVVGSYWYRIRCFPSVIKHVVEGAKLILEEFKKHVHDVPLEYYTLPQYHEIPTRDKWRAFFGVLQAKLPWHHPDDQIIPDYYGQWMQRYNRDEDMTNIYGIRVAAQ